MSRIITRTLLDPVSSRAGHEPRPAASPPLARLADQVAREQGQDVNRLVEAKTDFEAAAPDDHAVEMLAGLSSSSSRLPSSIGMSA
jgi:hypothetical protein